MAIRSFLDKDVEIFFLKGTPSRKKGWATIHKKVINRIINERAGVTPEIAVKLAAAFNTTPDFWLNAQMAMDLWSLRSQNPKIRSLIRLRRRRTDLKLVGSK